MEKQYELVCNGELIFDRNNQPVITGFVSEKPDGYSSLYPPGGGWLPVEDKDSQKFDPFAGAHFRDAPTFEVKNDCVIRVYQIIAQRK